MPLPSFDPEQVYHIWTHANGRENLFRVEENYRYFLRRYAHYIHPIVDAYVYCLMPNHLHLMVRIKNEEEVLAGLRRGGQLSKGVKPLEGSPKRSASNFPICSTPIPRPTIKCIKGKAACLSQTSRETR